MADFSLAQPMPNFFGEAQNAFLAGQKQALHTRSMNALASYGADPSGSINAMMQVDPETAIRMQQGQAAQAQAQREATTFGQGQQDRTANIAGTTALAAGDYGGAQAQFGKTGNSAAMESVQQHQQAIMAAKQTFAQQEAARLQGVLAQHRADPDGGKAAVMSAFTAMTPTYKQLNFTDQELQPIAQALAQDPQGTLTAIAGAPKVTTEKFGPGDNLASIDAAGNITHITGYGAPDEGAQPGAAAAGGSTPYLGALAQVESGGNPAAKNGQSTGLYQFHPDTFANLVPGGDINNPADQQKAATAYAQQNGAAFQQKTGQQATPDQLYLMHQQGPTGGLALLTAAPNTTAVAALESAGIKPDIALASIQGNLPTALRANAANMSAQDFTHLWSGKFNAAMQAQPQAQGQAPAGGQTLGGVPFTSLGSVPGMFDKATIQNMAQQQLLTGKPPPGGYGRGKAAPMNIKAVNDMVAQIQAETGMTGADAVVAHAGVGAATNAIAKVQSQLAAIEPFEETAKKNGDIVLGLLDKDAGSGGQYPIVNRWIRGGRKAIAGDPQVSAFDAAVQNYAGEMAKVISGASSGGGSSSDSARHEVLDAINSNMSPAAIRSVIGVQQQDMNNRVGSLYEQQTKLQGAIRNAVPPRPGQAASSNGGQAQTAAPVKLNPANPDADYAKLPPGALYIGPDGHTRKK